ncbi:MAG: branched-chain amino acid transaminase [Candidatus Aminicenantales bacterium]
MFANTHFPGAKKYWYMGSFQDWSGAGLHLMTHAFHYGTCTFEGIRAYNTKRGPAVFRLPEHIDRFFHSASVLRMTPPYSKDEIMEATKALIKENALSSAYIRPLMFYSYGNLGLVPKFSPVELVIGAWEWGAYLGEKAAQGIAGFIVPQRRIHHSQFDMKAKLGGVYVQSMICGTDARSKGYDEAVFLNLEGRVAEGPGENIFIVRNRDIKTNSLRESVLEGITRTSLLEIAAGLGYKTEIGHITKNDLFQADEAFFSGTAVEITPIVSVADGSDPAVAETKHVIGDGKPGKVTLELKSAYMDVVAGKNPKYEKWLTYVS